MGIVDHTKGNFVQPCGMAIDRAWSAVFAGLSYADGPKERWSF
jgi:hypothetical protein